MSHVISASILGSVFGNQDHFLGLAIFLDTFRNDLHGMDVSVQCVVRGDWPPSLPPPALFPCRTRLFQQCSLPRAGHFYRYLLKRWGIRCEWLPWINWLACCLYKFVADVFFLACYWNFMYFNSVNHCILLCFAVVSYICLFKVLCEHDGFVAQKWNIALTKLCTLSTSF